MFSSKHLLTTSWATVEKEWRRVKAVAQHGSRHVSKAATFTLKVNSLHFLLLLCKQWLWQYVKSPSNYAFVICRPVSGPLTNNLQQPSTTIQGIPVFPSQLVVATWSQNPVWNSPKSTLPLDWHMLNKSALRVVGHVSAKPWNIETVTQHDKYKHKSSLDSVFLGNLNYLTLYFNKNLSNNLVIVQMTA